MRRARRGSALALVVALLLTAGCADSGKDEAAERWHGGQIYLGTGNTTGVYYQLGGGLADIITRHLDGYQARAEPTGASGDNVVRIANGDMDIGFSLADTAADGYEGRASFTGRPQRVQAIARIYRNYTHVIVRKAAGISSFADLRGKRVSTGSANSGTDVIAGRLLTVAGIDPDAGITRLRLSLPETVKRMRAGEVDALFWSGGLPTPGITDLFAAAGDTVTFLPIADLTERLNQRFGPVYSAAELPRSAYGTARDVPTVAVANLILVSPELPDDLVESLTRLIFMYQAELGEVHPEGRNFDRASAADTDPVPLHPGAKRFYRSG
ncbi:TAXI family TRAP transporter solute-binding subunit [Melissospora conviva]|uniref:TAXI family TRAP transporter solute-binding subunit n=1 Tax=Melissospora conviva TaxID=3388432 RepID=UPI003B7B9AB5